MSASTTMNDPDPRILAILDAAFGVFISYGFRRTTMDDIARAAGMSRPALYTHFRNKEAIFRAYAELLRDRVLAEARAYLAAPGPVGDALAETLEIAYLRPYRALLETPHGVELIGVNKEIAGDVHTGWLTGVEDILTGWLASEQAEGRLAFGAVAPRAVARFVVNATEGIKSRDQDLDRASAEIALMAQMLARAYSPRR